MCAFINVGHRGEVSRCEARVFVCVCVCEGAVAVQNFWDKELRDVHTPKHTDINPQKNNIIQYLTKQ